MIWVIFLLSAAAIVLAATQLAKYGDAIALRTHLGGMFVGTLLLAGATSLPEVLTTLSSINQNVPNLAAGNLIGSNMINMALLAVIDILHRKERILRKAALRHALTGTLTMLLISLVVLLLIADIDLKIGWVGVDSLTLILAYILAVRLLQSGSLIPASSPGKEQVSDQVPSLKRSLIGFGLASLVLVLVAPQLVRSSAQIAEITGLGTTFVGTSLVALVTSLPELVTTIAAARIGANDMAIGNLFGSNMFNMFALGLTDFFYLPGRFLGVVDPSFVLVAVIGLLMTGMALLGNLARLEKRFLFIEIDAALILLLYFGGLGLMFVRGIGG